MKKKHNDLQPWLDYFGLLRTYADKGFLEMKPDRHEAYITRAALLTLAGIDPAALSVPVGFADGEASEALAATARHIRAYAAYLAQQGEAWLNDPFALHVVKEDPPHDLLFTLLLSRRRGRWKPWSKEQIEVITYDEPRNNEKSK